MIPAQAKLILTPQAIREAITVLTAVDTLVGDEYNKRVKAGKKKLPAHSESQIHEITKKAFENMAGVHPAAAAHGSHFGPSLLINMLDYIHMPKERDIALGVTRELVG